MKSFGKVLTIAAVAVGCSMVTAPKASADQLLMTYPDSSFTYTSPMWINQSAVVVEEPAPIIRTAPVITSPVVTNPVVIRERDRGLLRLGIPGLVNFSLF